MTEILRTRSLSQAYALHTALEAAGIEAAVNGEYSLGTIASGLTVVIFDDTQADAACAILNAMAAGD